MQPTIVSVRGAVAPAPSELPTLGQRLGEILPLVFFVPVAGPPAILLVGPLLLLTLLLIPPAALLITFVLVFLIAAVLLAALGALIASPYLLVRHLRARHLAPRTAPGSVRPHLIHLTTR
jgi:hypothetical protein